MATAVETLGKLERRITISFPLTDVRTEVEKRLKVQARTAKAPGFRPGKVPLKMVAAQYGYQIESEVLNDKVGRAFNDAANENNLRVAGFPNIVPKEEAAEGQLAFDATFEVYPEVAIGDLTAVEIETVQADVSEAEIDKTIDILRKQRVHFHTKGEAGEHGDGGEPIAANGDRVTVDFVGSIDGVEFPGGKAEGYAFVLGEGRMLPEFEAATLGLKVGESKTFPLSFPEDYHGKDVAGKTASFTITLQKLEWAHLPEVDAEFAKSLGVADGDLAKMREDIKVNLQREVAGRVKARNKEAVMDALIKVAELEVPKTLIAQDSERLAEMTRQDMAQRGMNVKDVPFPAELFADKAERRVRLGLILSQLVGDNKLQATPEQVKAQIEDFAQSYEDPREVLKYYYSDRRRLGEIEALVLEENVVTYVLGLSKVTTKAVAFDELMGSNAQA
ncbi:MULTISPECIES: trigger factor [unclassified Janthinobacterium]|uniref:trigger factor n=1 Tax=unclassified Janthinobacterium TaxID=2610881 RepID=UPI0009838CD6|nr:MULTISPECIES: trigger factor [unclassified Janthinobacterium]AQR71970.1 trigger factor [Janthinobacterium sp. LM6]MDN2672056.1 trigger factor [Janthinobacterium sp. SUN026]MDN2676468.1 trigger factor [Janthinobacterium sp. SUN033]MDN2700627.1 trigger factor [Janthinobacterium sp. SUN100]MDN2714332.1 trigger factor [Janthinobacterium sp. SUN120]